MKIKAAHELTNNFGPILVGVGGQTKGLETETHLDEEVPQDESEHSWAHMEAYFDESKFKPGWNEVEQGLREKVEGCRKQRA